MSLETGRGYSIPTIVSKLEGVISDSGRVVTSIYEGFGSAANFGNSQSYRDYLATRYLRHHLNKAKDRAREEGGEFWEEPKGSKKRPLYSDEQVAGILDELVMIANEDSIEGGHLREFGLGDYSLIRRVEARIFGEPEEPVSTT
jgi:hypothetical protein